MKPYANILVSVDFSRHSSLVIRRAVELVNFYQARLWLLNVLEDISLGNVAFGGMGKLPMNPTMKKTQLTQSADKLRKLAEELQVPANTQLDVVYAEGKFSEALLHFVKDKSIDLVLVTNTSKKGALGFLGATEATLKNLPCDILTVHM